MKNNTQPALKERIEKALEDFTKGRASMHVPPLDTDFDMVLAECSDRLSELEARCAALAAENAGLKAEVPMGAIVNGRAFADRLEAYPFECQGGNLNMCSDWQELLRCFEHLSEWAMRGQPETPATDAFLAEVRASAVDEVCLKISNAIVNCYQDEQIGLDAAATICGDLASEIRKGVQS
ncbi:hypothetical protein [Enterobacter asburiae]|uniref:hypothetical protein n=1 Tax=Enterobacter asburiae TaxID=61645 RepID=UPI001E486512|nr:hypothetical protein [Enterobacter asburiae]MCE1325740.1 hypothetical protein [Enterobacter asburiae]